MWPGDAGNGRAAFWRTQLGYAAVIGDAWVDWEKEVGEDAPGTVEVE